MRHVLLPAVNVAGQDVQPRSRQVAVHASLMSNTVDTVL